MNRNEFILVTAIVLLLAFALGWLAHAVIARLRKVTAADMGELETLAQALHDTEEERDRALVMLETREAELEARAAQAEAELRATMEGLRESRQEAEEMRAYIERMHSAG